MIKTARFHVNEGILDVALVKPGWAWYNFESRTSKASGPIAVPNDATWVVKALAGALPQVTYISHRGAVQRVVWSFKKAAQGSELANELEQGLGVLKRMKLWHSKFPQVLARASTEGVPKGWVWQDAFVTYFEDGEGLQNELRMVDTALEDIAGDDAVLASLARDGTSEPPRPARIDHAISKFDFFPDAKGEDNIAYDIGTLQEWARSFGSWMGSSTRVLQGTLQKVRRVA
jgi:hypothetical protein